MGFNILIEDKVKILFDYQFSSFFNPTITSQQIIEMMANYFRANNFGYIWKILRIKFTFYIFSLL